jgi:hypothetical protein
MRLQSSSFLSAVAIVAASTTASSSALAQACCAGASAVTPGRLELHEDELVGVQLKAGSVIGSYQTSRQFLRNPAGVGEIDLEQDVFGAVRVLRRGQLALLAPVIETQRRAPTAGTAFGGGIGDINMSARYDFVLAGESQWVPGIALLAGVTFPAGKPPDQATQPLAVDATGIGAFQFNGALALEQTFGPWLVNATGIVAQRTTYQRETLATQVTLLAALAYTFPNDAGLAFSGSYVFEGDATSSQGGTVPLSAKSVTTFTLSGLWPITDVWRVIGSAYLNPPIDSFGSNQLADAGLSAGVIRSWM